MGDANRLYFTENPPARDSIAQVSVNGGETAPLAVPFDNPIVADVSPQGSELLVTKAVLEGMDNPFCSVPIPADSPRLLGQVSAHDALWAPNGKLIFAKANDIYIAELGHSSVGHTRSLTSRIKIRKNSHETYQCT